ncbi:MAG TPA: sigma-70 family RNA polymerase sigma factor [Turneriella sp.]|nr:sigma-70 family RNA polymerase sigma factor [Turneriella sp.]
MITSVSDSSTVVTAELSVEALFLKHKTQLLRYLHNFVGNDEADDVLQDVFISFLAQKRAEKIRATDELGWLYRACHNRAIDYIRKRKKLIYFTEEKFDRMEATEENKNTRTWTELRDTLHTLALRFGKKGEGILLLHLLEEGKPKILIAEIMEITDRHLRRRIESFYQFLQQELKKLGIEKIELE